MKGVKKMKSVAVEIKNLKARDVMRADVVFVSSDMAVAELADLLQTHNITGVPVVNSKGKVIGVVSETDIVAADALKESEEKETPHYFRSGWEEGQMGSEAIDYEKMSFPLERSVEDIMTPWVISVEEDTPVVQIAQKMLADRVHRVLVMDSKGHLKGIVSSMDIIHLVAEEGK